MILVWLVEEIGGIWPAVATMLLIYVVTLPFAFIYGE